MNSLPRGAYSLNYFQLNEVAHPIIALNSRVHGPLKPLVEIDAKPYSSKLGGHELRAICYDRELYSLFSDRFLELCMGENFRPQLRRKFRRA